MSSQRAERVYLAGASLAALGGAVSRQLNNTSKSQVRSRGVVGVPINGWVGTVKAALPAELAVVLEAGGNGVPTPADIQAADRRLRENGFSSPVWVTWPAWRSGRVVDARARTTANILAAGVRVCPCDAGSVSTDLTSDGVHLSATGGAKVLSALRALPDWPEVYRTSAPSRPDQTTPPLPPADIYAAMVAASNRHGVPLALILALTKQESNWNPRAESHNRRTGRPIARGLGQLIRSTAAGEGYTNWDDMFDPMKGADACASHLKRLYSRAPARNSDPWTWVLGAYRCGAGAWNNHLAGRPIAPSAGPELRAALEEAVRDAVQRYIPSITRRVAEYVGG